MTGELDQELRAMREQFDRGFAQAPQAELAAPHNILAIRLGGEPFALALAQIAGLYVDRRIMALPSALPALLGLTSFRGQVAPVYDLALLLGRAAATAPRWQVLLRAAHPVALAFETFEEHLCVPAAQIIGALAHGGERAHGERMHDLVQDGSGTRPIIHLASLLDDIQQQAEQVLQQRSH